MDSCANEPCGTDGSPQRGDVWSIYILLGGVSDQQEVHNIYEQEQEYQRGLLESAQQPM